MILYPMSCERTAPKADAGRVLFARPYLRVLADVYLLKVYWEALNGHGPSLQCH